MARVARAGISLGLALFLVVGVRATGQGSHAPRPQEAKRPLYAIQVGASENRIEADDLALKVARTTNLPALVQPATVHDRKFFRVRVYANSRAESRRLAARLRRDAFRTWIVALP